MNHFSRLVALLSILLIAGCSKSPSGGPAAPNAPNRLIVNFRTQAPINNAYIYAFAFDDDDDSSDGPAAIVSSTSLPNGVVGGSFTVLVIYQAGQYTVFRRTDLGNGNEQLERIASAFVTPPAPATGNNLSFTLNMDATSDTGTRLFRADLQRLDINFVTTNEIRRDPNDLRRKAFDAFGPNLASFYATLDVRGNRVYANPGAMGVQEPTGDVQTDDTNNTINLGQLDISDFSLSVERR